ncbi:hypothetical protein [Jannaschia rubra]|uniref:Lipoprotein n=1 Tax=Jannaschia rubra TaxID=282197 RepID=A0A0M6XVI5_9RHOB|nr:hypothetical protein [Jannaschia rubra]CTQ34281.1 hypothetical protein JAN5088_03075 [Jannaschia rubra]SFG18887.1 hypothetical protein SAMN04488517_10362 [Jannaschia rubra]
MTYPLRLIAALSLTLGATACMDTAGTSPGTLAPIERAAPGTTAPVGPDSGPCRQGLDATGTGTCVVDESED